MNPDLTAAFDAFTTRTRLRMETGARTYGNHSLSAKPAALLDEIQEELEDVAGWTVLMWYRLEQLRQDLEPQEDRGAGASDG